MNWYLTVIKEHYADFKGRARRKEFWMFVLINFVISVVVSIIGGLLGFSFLSGIYSLAVLVPSIAVSVRRMHDVGKSGWFVLIPLYNLYLSCLDSQAEANEWGANPKA